MNLYDLGQQIQEMLSQLIQTQDSKPASSLQQAADTHQQLHSVTTTLGQLRIALKEYLGANEKLQQQNKELVATQAMLLRDVADPKQLSEQQWAYKRLQLVMTSLNCIVYDWEIEIGRVDRTQGIFEVLGYRPEETEPTVAWWLERIHPDDRQRLDREVEDAFRRVCSTLTTEYRISNKNNDYLHVWDRGVIIRDALGKPLRLVGSVFNVTERKQDIEALQQAKEQLEAVLDAVPGFVSWISADGRYLGVNRHLADSFNLPSNVFIGQELGFLHSSLTFAEFIRNFLASSAASAAQIITSQVNNNTRNYLIVAQKYQQGNAVVSVGIDITERQQAEEALQKLNKELETRVKERTIELEQKHQELKVEIAQRQRFESALRRREQEFRALAENAPDIILRFDRQLRHVYVNPAMELATAKPCHEFIGKTSRELNLPEAYVSIWEQAIGKIFKTGQGAEIEFNFETPQGLRYYQTRLVPEFVLDGVDGRDRMSPISVLGICRDITERKQVEEALRNSEQAARAQVEELEKLNWLKDEFLSTVSHELRTPLTNMKMAITMLQAASKPEQRDRYMQILQDECTREINLVNDLLDLQRLEAGGEAIDLEKLELQSWLPGVVEPFQARAQARQQTLSLEVPSDLPSIITHPANLERVLAELLNNACKYAPPGEIITVIAKKLPFEAGDNAQSVALVVRNTGSEIPASELDLIFEKFYRVANSDPWKQPGTGLGLALVRKLVELLGGRVWVESQAQETAFSVKLPAL